MALDAHYSHHSCHNHAPGLVHGTSNRKPTREEPRNRSCYSKCWLITMQESYQVHDKHNNTKDDMTHSKIFSMFSSIRPGGVRSNLSHSPTAASVFMEYKSLIIHILLSASIDQPLCRPVQAHLIQTQQCIVAFLAFY